MRDGLRPSPSVSSSFEAFAPPKVIKYHEPGDDRVVGQFVKRVCTPHAATYRT